MKKLLISSVILCNILFANESTKDPDTISHELSECTAFYMIASKGATDEKISNQLKDKAESAFNSSVTLAESKDRDNAMAQKVVNSRIFLEIDRMKKEINNDYKNFSILTAKYATTCNNLTTKYENIFNRNIGFMQNQKYVCINQGMLVNSKLEKVMSDEDALKYPIRFYIDNKSILNTDAGLKLPVYKSEEQFYKNDNTAIKLIIDKNQRYMFFMDKLMNYVPAVYLCNETDNWTLTK